MIRKNVSGGMLLEVIMTLGIMMLMFPLLQKNVFDRAERMKQEQVMRDMTLLKSLVEEYIENIQGISAFGDRELVEIPAARIASFLDGRTRRNFERPNALGQTYSIKLRRRAKTEGTQTGFDAIIVADGAEVPSHRLREIVRESRGAGGYVEGDEIFGATWTLPLADWQGARPLSPDALVFKVGEFRRDALFLSRTNPRYALMRTDIFMRGNDVLSAGSIDVSGKLETASLTLAEGSNARMNEMALAGGLSLRGALAVDGVMTFITGLIRQNDVISGGEVLQELEIADALNIMGALRLSAADNRVKLADAMRLSSMLADGLDIAIGNRFYAPSMEGAIEGSFVEALEFNVRALNMKRVGWEGTVGLHFHDRLSSAADAKFGIRRARARNLKTGREEERETGPLGYYSHDVVVRNLSEQLAGQVIGGIKITEDTPVSVIIRALNYEYADLYKLITGNAPKAGERYVPEYSLPPNLRCHSLDCSGKQDWNKGR